MPTTINGVGTHYYGKKNRALRTAACRSCHRVGPLESYDTRLWFVVVFIPVIPLGRKRVIDQCPSCSRHAVASAHAFETARQLQTSEALEQYRREPSAENALVAHAQLLTFGEHEQATDHRQAVLARLPGHAELRAGLANQLLQLNSFQEAMELFDEALALQPELPEARIGVALGKMAHDALDEARGLLDFLEEPGAGQQYPLGPLDSLSSLYQQAGRHEEALELAGVLLRELPGIGQQHEFRAFVGKSERALRRTESILPPLQHSLGGLFRARGSAYPAWQRRLVLGGLALGLVTVGLLINNEYIRRHRTLHVVNATGAPVEVRVDDEAPATIGPGLGRLVVAEGPHRVQLGGPVQGAVEVVLESGFFDRWFRRPLWVLNPGGEAVLREATLYYAENPRPAESHTLSGQPFVAISHVDYPFETPPESLEVKKRGGEVVKTAVEWVQGADEEALFALAAEDRAAALDFAERRLRRDPQQEGLLESYLQTAGVEAMPRVEAFLAEGLDLRPIPIVWHRMYQQAAEINGRDPAELVSRYDRMLAAEPENAALLYLRGRIEPAPKREAEFFERSVAADPRLAWPRFALGVQASAEARWDEALVQLNHARELGLPADLLNEPIHVTRLALGEAEALVGEYRARLAAHPHDPTALVLLADALASTGQEEAIASELASWESQAPPEIRAVLAAPVRAMVLYQAGDLEASEQVMRSSPMLQTSPVRLQPRLALGELPEALEVEPSAVADQDAWTALAVSLALALEGRADEADRWREAACQALATLAADEREAARALRSPTPPTLEQLRRVVFQPEDRALLLAVLARRFPDRQADYHAEAGRFNLRRLPPYHLVRRAINGAP